jgi:hypothetical protein
MFSHVVAFNDVLQRKCDIYWPEVTREPVYYGDLVVEVESESIFPDYVLRVMSVKLVRIIFLCCVMKSMKNSLNEITDIILQFVQKW